MNNVDIVRVVLQNSIFILLPVLLGRERKPMCAVIQVHSNRKCGTKSLVCTRRILGRDYCKLGQKPKKNVLEHLKGLGLVSLSGARRASSVKNKTNYP